MPAVFAPVSTLRAVEAGPSSIERHARRLFPVLLVLLAFALRLYRLDGQDIWGDEAWSISVSGRSLQAMVAGDAETNPPLYHLVLSGSRQLLGHSPFALRYPSVVAGLLALVMLVPIGRLLAGRGLALWSLAAGAASPFLIFYAQETRMYGLALLGAAGSLWFFLALIAPGDRGPGRGKLWWGYAFCSLVAVYSHYFAFAILLVQALFVLLVAHRAPGDVRSGRTRGPVLRLPRWLLVWLLMALAFLPWLLVQRRFLTSKASARFDEWTLARLAQISRDTLLAFANGTTLHEAERSWGWLVVALAVAGAWYLARRKGWPGMLPGGLMLGGLVFAWLVNPIMPFFFERYLLVCMPAFLLLVGAGLQQLGRWRRPLSPAGLTGLLILHGLSLSHYYHDPTFAKGGYGRLMATISRQAATGDLLLLNNPLQAALYDYYGPPDLRAVLLSRDEIHTPERRDNILAAATAGHSRVWLVETGNPAEYDPEHEVQAWLGRVGSFVYNESFIGARLLLFDLAPRPDDLEAVAYRLGDDIWLTGYALGPGPVAPGETLRLTLQWQAAAAPAEDFTVFNHLLDETGRLVAQADGPPVGGSRPTSGWLPGETLIDSYAIQIPLDSPPGHYRLVVGLYRWPALTRLPITDVAGRAYGDHVLLATVTLGSEE